MDTRRVSALVLLVAISFVLLFHRPGHATDAVDWGGFRLEVVRSAGPRPDDPAGLRIETQAATRGLRARYLWRALGGEWMPLPTEGLALTRGGRLEVLADPDASDPAAGSDDGPPRRAARPDGVGSLTVPAAALEGRAVLLGWKRVEPHGLSIEVASRWTDEPGAVRAGARVSTATRGTGPLVPWSQGPGPGADAPGASAAGPRLDVAPDRAALVQPVGLADGRRFELGIELLPGRAPEER